MRWAAGRCVPSGPELLSAARPCAASWASSLSGEREPVSNVVAGWRPAASAMLAAVLLLPTSGCVAECAGTICGALPPAVTATIRDASDGGTVPGAVVNGFPFSCAAACPVQLPDGGFPYQAGSVPLAVSAPGYVTQSRTVEVPARSDESCCPLPYHPQQVDVALVPG